MSGGKKPTLSQDIRKYVTRRKIVKVELQPLRDASGIHYNPVIHLDNGARLLFTVSETDNGGDYGINPIIVKPREE